MEETTKPEESKTEASAPVENQAAETTQPAAEESTQSAEQYAQESTQPAETTPEGTMKLGGGIELEGFSGIEKAQLVVIKKMVGNYVKEITEKAKKYEKVVLTLTQEGNSCKVHAELTDEGNQITADATENNLFIALNKALKEVIDKQATS